MEKSNMFQATNQILLMRRILINTYRILHPILSILCQWWLRLRVIEIIFLCFTSLWGSLCQASCHDHCHLPHPGVTSPDIIMSAIPRLVCCSHGQPKANLFYTLWFFSQVKKQLLAKLVTMSSNSTTIVPISIILFQSKPWYKKVK